MYNTKTRLASSVLLLSSVIFIIGAFFISTAAFAAPLFDVNENQVLSYQQAHNDCALNPEQLVQKYGQELAVKAAQYCQSGNAAEIAAFCSIDDGLSSSEINDLYDEFYSKYLDPIDATGNGNYGDQFCEAASLLGKTDGSIREDITDQQRNALGNAEERIIERDALAVNVLENLGCNDRASTGPTDICEQPDFRIISYCRNPEVTDSACAEVKERFPDQTVLAQSTADQAAGEAVESCEDNDGEFVFFICAIIEGMSSTINKLDSQVRKALDINQEYYESEGVRGAWANMRNIAYILLIPVMLVMVIGTALGFSFVDAYTVKRAIPRMFAAIIFIALSYDICVLLIEITTTVGKGIGGLIAAPFGGTSELVLTKIFAPTTAQGGAVLGVGVIGGIALVGLGAVSLGILASYLFIGAISLIIIFAVLTLREMIVLFLVILSPIAIIAWIFPGNDKPWKLWWSSFSKLLYLFPMIVGLLVMGRAFASILGTVGGDGLEGIFLTFGKLVAYIGPFFFIPALFKFAGGVFGNLAGMANDRSKGVFDRQRKYRGEKRKQTYQDAKMGNRFKQTPGLRNLNSAVQRGVLQKEAGFSVGATRRGRVDSAVTRNSLSGMEELMEKNPDYMPWKNDDSTNYAASMWAQNGEKDRESLKVRLRNSDPDRFSDERELDKTAEQIIATRKTSEDSAFMRATAIQAIAGGSVKELKSDEGMDNAAGKAAKFINGATKGDSNARATVIAKYRSAATNAGRMDQGMAGMGPSIAAVNAFDNSNANLETINDQLMESVIDSTPAGHALHGKPESGQNIYRYRAKKIQRLANNIGGIDPVTGKSVSRDDVTQELASVMGMLDAAGSAAPQMSKMLSKELTGARIIDPQSGQSMSVLDLGNHPAYLADDAYAQMRNDFKTNNLRGSQQFQAQQAMAEASRQNVPGQQQNPGSIGGI